MDKKTLKDVLEMCKQGKFDESLQKLYSIGGEINDRWAIALILGCCGCVNNNSCTETISGSDLFDLMKHLALNIKDINETLLYNYMHPLYLILQWFIKKVKFLYLRYIFHK